MLAAFVAALSVAAAISITVLLALTVATLLAAPLIGVAVAVRLVGIVAIGRGCLGSRRILHLHILFGGLLEEGLNIIGSHIENGRVVG